MFGTEDWPLISLRAAWMADPSSVAKSGISWCRRGRGEDGKEERRGGEYATYQLDLTQ